MKFKAAQQMKIASGPRRVVSTWDGNSGFVIQGTNSVHGRRQYYFVDDDVTSSNSADSDDATSLRRKHFEKRAGRRGRVEQQSSIFRYMRRNTQDVRKESARSSP